MPDTILSQPPLLEQEFGVKVETHAAQSSAALGNLASSLLDPARAAALVRRWDLAGDPIRRLAEQQRRSEMIARRMLRDEHRRELVSLAREAEQAVAAQLRAWGYLVHLTTHKCPFDLWVANEAGRAARVEVKISLYNQNQAARAGRFQASIHNDADLVVFIARNGKDWPFVIPMPVIAPRRNIALWSECPADYTGQWAPYLEAWDHLHQAVEQGQARAWQLPLFQEGQ